MEIPNPADGPDLRAARPLGVVPTLTGTEHDPAGASQGKPTGAYSASPSPASASSTAQVPTDPALAAPAPADPAPADQVPADPADGSPALADPAPTASAATDPTPGPADQIPTAPAPVDPAGTSPTAPARTATATATATDPVDSAPTSPTPTPTAPGRRIPRRRLVLLGMGGACLLAGLNAALLLADLPALVSLDRLADVHGQLMLLGFLGTLIALERAVALRTRWALLSPALLGAGGILLLTALPTHVGSTVQAVGATLLVAVYARLWQRAGSAALLIQWLGAVLVAGAALLWAVGVGTPVLVPWFAGFLVLTIAGERLELARIGGPSPAAQHLLLGLACATVLAAIAALLWPAPGTELTGLALLGIAAWLLRHDVARRTLRASGLPRYAAVNIMAGIGWLVVAGSTWLLLGFQDSGPGYDLVIHAVGLGFAMSMVLAHAPIILPAVLLRPLPYRPVLYASTALLQGSLLLRAVGDIRELPAVWQAGSGANVLALVVFLLTAVTLVVRR